MVYVSSAGLLTFFMSVEGTVARLAVTLLALSLLRSLSLGGSYAHDGVCLTGLARGSLDQGRQWADPGSDTAPCAEAQRN
jgi:riboflavin synthase alpha subunit